MGDLLRRAFVIARQRSDVGRRMPGMEVCTWRCPSLDPSTMHAHVEAHRGYLLHLGAGAL